MCNPWWAQREEDGFHSCVLSIDGCDSEEVGLPRKMYHGHIKTLVKHTTGTKKRERGSAIVIDSYFSSDVPFDFEVGRTWDAGSKIIENQSQIDPKSITNGAKIKIKS